MVMVHAAIVTGVIADLPGSIGLGAKKSSRARALDYLGVILGRQIESEPRR